MAVNIYLHLINITRKTNELKINIYRSTIFDLRYRKIKLNASRKLKMNAIY